MHSCIAALIKDIVRTCFNPLQGININADIMGNMTSRERFITALLFERRRRGILIEKKTIQSFYPAELRRSGMYR